jgi:hypothetical protein
MPRYFFHLIEGKQHFRDEHGRELPDLIEAHTVALDIISKCLRYIPDWPVADARITVALASGEPVLSVLFPALTSPARPCFGQRSKAERA